MNSLQHQHPSSQSVYRDSQRKKKTQTAQTNKRNVSLRLLVEILLLFCSSVEFVSKLSAFQSVCREMTRS